MPKKVAIIAAEGLLPMSAARALRTAGRSVFVVQLKGIADADFSGFDSCEIVLGKASSIIEAVKAKGCKEVAFIGKMKRPRLRDFAFDKLGLELFFKFSTMGDDAALRGLAQVCSDNGIELIDASSLMGEFAPQGIIAGSEPSEEVLASINFGKGVLASLGDFDVGQAVVVQGERVIAIEAAEGTNEMIKRSKPLIDKNNVMSVLVKMMKASQAKDLDVPVIGVETVALAAKASIKIIAVEAGGVLLIGGDDLRAEASKRGVSIIGIKST